VKHRSEGATALLGMPGFVVGAQMELDGELWLHVDTTADVVGCRSCGTKAVGHGRRRVKVRDLPMAGQEVMVVWAKRIWRCVDADCEVRTWSEDHPAIAARASLTERARAEICRRVGQDDDSVAKVARASAWAGARPWRRYATTASPWWTIRSPRGRGGARPRRDGDAARRLSPPHHLRHRLRRPGPGPTARHRPAAQRFCGGALARRA
jgi:hypothetical protein